MSKELFRNIILTNTSQTSQYTSPQTPRGGLSIPKRDRRTHGNRLISKLESAWQKCAEKDSKRSAISVSDRNGMYLEFSSLPGHDLKIKSLEDLRAGVRLLNVKEKSEGDNKVTRATVYIPAGKEAFFLKKFTEYLHKNTQKDNPKNAELVNSIEGIELAILEAFWIGKDKDLPKDAPVWCEVWLRVPFSNDIKTEEQYAIVKRKFIEQCNALEIEYKDEIIKFPERAVMLIRASRKQLQSLIEYSEFISEFRKAAETADFFTNLSNIEQSEWVEDLLDRLQVSRDSNTSICILDTGLNNGHRLISPVATDNDLHTYDPSWGTDDNYGHGTEMAGIAAYYNLEDIISTDVNIFLPHKLESVKILPPKGENDPNLYGYITQQAVSLAEIERPNANRVVCMAVTAPNNNTDNGSPTSWSASIDSITSGYTDDVKRLLIISGGNVHLSEISEHEYPLSNELHSIESPGQSWNAITVGAYTEKILIEDDTFDGYAPLADAGDLSPYSSTSLFWDKKWPIKPEILCEGGNVAYKDTEYTDCDDLSLLTTHYRPIIRNFTTINATSAATAQASWIAAQIAHEYPEFWPETVRALMIHSAEWTNTMISKYIKNGTKKEYYKLLRSCGYGVPNLERALRCARNSVNLIIQDELQPYHKVKSDYKTKEMHLHELPFPREVLLELGEIDVSMRVTLSYFIEPSPGEIGWKNRYRYPSCGLRFDVNNINETREEFEQRMNKKMRDDDYEGSDSGSERWKIGSNNRHLGSIHSDIWTGTAAQLCESNLISIYPTIGWWRERHYLKRWNKKIRYSLIVSLTTPRESIDLYTPIMNKIESEVKVENKAKIEINI